MTLLGPLHPNLAFHLNFAVKHYTVIHLGGSVPVSMNLLSRYYSLCLPCRREYCTLTLSLFVVPKAQMCAYLLWVCVIRFRISERRSCGKGHICLLTPEVTQPYLLFCRPYRNCTMLAYYVPMKSIACPSFLGDGPLLCCSSWGSFNFLI